MKPIEERVKNIVETSALLNIKEKSEIICLIECYKSADKLAQELYKENEKLKDQLNWYELQCDDLEMELGDFYD